MEPLRLKPIAAALMLAFGTSGRFRQHAALRVAPCPVCCAPRAAPMFCGLCGGAQRVVLVP